MASNSTMSKPFDPFDQQFTILMADGKTPFVANTATIDMLVLSAVYQTISQASQLGAGFILLIALLLMTKTDKRRSAVFILNATALALVVLRGILACLVYTGPFYDWFRWSTFYYEGEAVQHAKVVSSTGEVTSFLLTLVIELSLVMQVRIVCCTLEPPKRHPINITACVVALVPVGLRFALMVLQIKWGIVHVETEAVWQFLTLSKLASACNIALVISIGVSVVIFCAKLAFAIRARRSMGMNQFGPMQIIFVMGCQTMFTPLIFTLIAYFAVKNAQLQSVVPTIVAISLPLSAMWASANPNNINIAKCSDNKARLIPIGESDLASGKTYGFNEKVTSNASTLIDDSYTEVSRSKSAHSSRSGTDLEMQKLGPGVQVDRTYTVRSD